MDPNGNIIPIVEGDQGEGFKDPLDMDGLKETIHEQYIERREKMFWRKQEKLRRKKS